jgi:hypothetical protein
LSRRASLRDEDGISLVVAVCSMALMLMLSSIGLKQAVNALHHSGHQDNVKRALQAADAAIDTAVFRAERADLGNAININPLHPETVTNQNCVISRGDVLGGVDLAPLNALAPSDPNGRKWCPTTDPEPVGDGRATSQYRMSQLLRVGTGTCGSDGALSLDREVVAVGRSGNVVRRVHARMRASLALLSGAAVQSGSSTQALTMRDTARVLGDVQANAAISGTVGNVISGSATAGANASVTGVVPVGASGSACQPMVLPQVAQGDAPATNDNTLRTDGCVDLTALISVSCKPLLVTTGGVTYDPATRALRVWGNGRAVLNGSTYSFCSIRLENSGILQIKSTTPVTRIFLDDPNNCRTSGALIPNAGQITMDGQARILNCHLQTQPESLQLYAVGNATIPTTQTLQGGALLSGTGRAALCGANVPLVGEPMVVYAPRSTIELGGSTAIAGQVVGNVVHMSGVSAVQPVNALINLGRLGGNPILPLYQAEDYVECTGRSFTQLPANDPAQGC